MRTVSADAQRAIRADYVAKGADGRYCYPLAEVARRNHTSVSVVSKVCKARGLSRYLTRGNAA